MKQNSNTRRLNEVAREEIASIVMFEISDPRLDMITITATEVSVDRSVCHVYVSTEPERYEEVLAGLESAKGRIRSLLAKKLSWRITPELFFHIDNSADEAERIARALQDRPEFVDIEKDEAGYPITGEDTEEDK